MLQFARTPYYVAFRAGALRLILCTVHIYYGEPGARSAGMARRVAEIERLTELLGRRARDEEDSDASNLFVVLGDFNIVGKDHHTMRALERHGFVVPDGIREIPAGTNVKRTKFYDQIAYWRRGKGDGGVIGVRPLRAGVHVAQVADPRERRAELTVGPAPPPMLDRPPRASSWEVGAWRGLRWPAGEGVEGRADVRVRCAEGSSFDLAARLVAPDADRVVELERALSSLEPTPRRSSCSGTRIVMAASFPMSASCIVLRRPTIRPSHPRGGRRSWLRCASDFGLHNSPGLIHSAAMPYVRRRGNHLAIVHGSRHPETKKVEQQVLMTIHSKAEALAALGRSSDARGWSLKQWMEHRYPELRFSWPKIEAGIDELKDELPDIARSREERALTGFDKSLKDFARHLLDADPQWLDSARELIEKNRSVLEWLVDLVEWRLEASERTEPSEWSRDPFGWRLALGGGTMDGDLEEGLAARIHDGRADEAEAIFRLLVDLYPRYAEGWNYLGLISLDRRDLEEALERFETCEQVGRKLFPKRIAKRDYWNRIETRPYMRAVMNQWVTLNRMGRYARALHLAERLESECGDDVTAAVYRASTYLNTGEWQLAYDAAVYAAGLYAEQSLLAALAAFELGELDEARARFRQAMLGKPRAVAMVLGKRSPEPQSRTEVMDHNAGVGLLEDTRGFLDARSASSKRFFTRLWKDEELAALREEVLAAERQMHEVRGPGGDEAEYRRLFDRLRELREPQGARQL